METQQTITTMSKMAVSLENPRVQAYQAFLKFNAPSKLMFAISTIQLINLTSVREGLRGHQLK
jgi:hypothetical protein